MMRNSLGGVGQMSLLQLFDYLYFNKTATSDDPVDESVEAGIGSWDADSQPLV